MKKKAKYFYTIKIIKLHRCRYTVAVKDTKQME